MKKRRSLVITIILMLTAISVMAQDCKFFYPDVKGAEIEITNYNQKDKITGISRQKIVGIEKAGNMITATIKNEYYDSKDQLTFENDMEVSCKDGIFYLDMNNYLNSDAMAGFKDMEMEIKGENLQFPSNLKVGDKLNDGTITISFDTPGMAMTMSTVVKNRVVEAFENITTPAGTFKCYKISYDIESKVIMANVSGKAVQWFSENVGMVRTESYDKNGKLGGYSVLTAIKK